MSSVKYVDLVSQSRNRNLYPNQSDFVANVSFGASYVSNAFQAQDPIANAYPTITAITQAGSSANQIILNNGSSTIPGFYNGRYLQIGSQYSTISSYDPTTQTVILNTPFSTPPAAGTTYHIRNGVPVFSYILDPGNTQNIVNLGPAVSSQDGFYNGMFIYFISGPNAGLSMLILDYSGATYLATLVKALPNIPLAGDAYDILQYTRDNFSPMIYSGSIGFGQAVCHSVELLYLTLPNQIISSGYGGTLANYPYLYLYLYNEGNMHADKVLYSNNPAAQSVLFKIPLGIQLSTETFFTLKDAKMINTCKIKLDQPLRFRLILPDGSPIVFQTADNFSPDIPNPMLQISATFAFHRIDTPQRQNHTSYV